MSDEQERVDDSPSSDLDRRIIDFMEKYGPYLPYIVNNFYYTRPDEDAHSK